MKRVSTLILFVMLAAVLAACGNTGGSTSSPAASSSAGAGTSSSSASASSSPSNGGEASSSASASDQGQASPSASASGGAAASASPEPSPVTLGAAGGEKVVIWHNWAGSYADAITKLLGEYADQNNVALELLNVPDLNQKVNVAIPAGQGPDVIAWVNDQIGKNAELGVIQPLGDKGIDRAYLEQNFVDTAVNAMEYQDKIWGVPESMESIAFIYNKDLVSEDKLPKSTDELLQKAKEFNQANQGKYYFVYQAGSAAGDAYHNAPWWYGNGAFYVDEEGKVGLASPESTRAGELLKQFSTIMPAQIDADVSRALFTEGNAAIWMTGPWSIADVEKAGINYGIATIPQISASGKPGQPFVGVKTMMLAEGAKNQESALNLMKYYGSKEFQAKLAQANKQVPANKAAQEQVKSDPVIAAFIEQTRNGTPLPNTPFMDALWAPTGEAQAAIWSGAQAPEAALKAAAEVATEKIEQIR